VRVARRHRSLAPGGARAPAERQFIRQMIAGQLAADWSPWMNAMIQAGRIRHAK
jgi:hypothetical protein